MRTPSYDLKQAMAVYGFTPVELPAKAKYEVGKTYWCNYWSKWYTVLDVEYDHWAIKFVKVKWQDGTIATHATSLDPARDWELVW